MSAADLFRADLQDDPSFITAKKQSDSTGMVVEDT
jgi:hypothetical protein